MILSLLKKIFHKAYLPKIENEGGIVESGFLEVNGFRQWYYARGKFKTNPLLLFLHPGPGLVATGMTNGYQTLLEERFIVIHLHMRGAGKSFNKSVAKTEISIGTLVDDTIEASRQLTARYGKSKLYIMGHSFGSLIALKAVKKSPDLFNYFISVAQMTDVREMEKRSFDFVLESATKEDDHEALKSLKKIGRSVDKLTIDGIKKKQELIHKFGGNAPGLSNVLEIIYILIIKPVEHSFSDVMNGFKGLRYSGSQLFKEACLVNFFQEINEVKTPVLMILGDHDQISNPELVKSYFDQLKAPQKQLIELKGLAHFPFLTQPNLFQNKLLEALRIG